jgi:death on curing protein
MTMFVNADQVQMFNAQFIGPDKLRDFGALDAAIMRPQGDSVR